MPNDSYCVTTMVDFGTKILGTQNATMKGIYEFKKSLNPEHLVSYMN
jgi:UDP-3-O-[3-hydroxymyristoyl] N-acetylglucosamine deacetylase/3-hydroxyacyl-[acyl-carrier-protein] dehydratase